MEPIRSSYDQLKARLEEAMLLIDACSEKTLLDALRRISTSPYNPLRAYVMGEELVVAVDTFSLVNINLKEGKVRTWDDWRDRLAAAAKAAADEVSKKLLALILDKGEKVPPTVRSELSRIITSIGKSEGEEFYKLLGELKSALRELSQSI
ncbi:MAG: hypothetical protein QXU69_11005 [Thermofilaceae archaeon]